MVDRGVTFGIIAWSSDRPMQAPESAPVQGMPSISGMSGLAAFVVKPCGPLLGTRKGTQVVVNESDSSPLEHWATAIPGAAVDKAAITGAAADATTKAPIRTCRRIAKEGVAIPGF